jgi:hypothetical protein
VGAAAAAAAWDGALPFLALHLRHEADWSKYCVSEAANSEVSQVRSVEQCFKSATEVAAILAGRGLAKAVSPLLYVASGKELSRDDEAAFEAAGFTLLKGLLREDGDAGGSRSWEEEMAAAREAGFGAPLEMAICARAGAFVGNLFSSFSYFVREQMLLRQLLAAAPLEGGSGSGGSSGTSLASAAVVPAATAGEVEATKEQRRAAADAHASSYAPSMRLGLATRAEYYNFDPPYVRSLATTSTFSSSACSLTHSLLLYSFPLTPLLGAKLNQTKPGTRAPGSCARRRCAGTCSPAC